MGVEACGLDLDPAVAQEFDGSLCPALCSGCGHHRIGTVSSSTGDAESLRGAKARRHPAIVGSLGADRGRFHHCLLILIIGGVHGGR